VDDSKFKLSAHVHDSYTLLWQDLTPGTWHCFCLASSSI